VCVSAVGSWGKGGRLGWECYYVRVVKLVSSVYNITVFIKIVSIWFCVCVCISEIGS